MESRLRFQIAVFQSYAPLLSLIACMSKGLDIPFTVRVRSRMLRVGYVVYDELWTSAAGEAAMELGDRIRELRQKAGLSQDELAKKVYVARQTVSNWENDKTLPDMESLKLLTAALGTTADDLLGTGKRELNHRSQEERHRALVLLGRNILWYGLLFAVQIIKMIAKAQGVNEGLLGYALSAAYLVTAVLWVRAWLQMRKYQQSRCLINAVQLVSFIEGRDPYGAPPNDWLYAIVSHWMFWGFAASTVLMFLLGATGVLG